MVDTPWQKDKFQKAAGGIINVNGLLNRIQEGIFQAVANPAFLRFVRKSKTSEADINIVRKQGLDDYLWGSADSSQLDTIIGGLQKAIQSPPISMEGNSVIWGQTIAK